MSHILILSKSDRNVILCYQISRRKGFLTLPKSRELWPLWSPLSFEDHNFCYWFYPFYPTKFTTVHWLFLNWILILNFCTNVSFFRYRWENYRKQHTSSTAKLADLTDGIERVRLWSEWPREKNSPLSWFCYRQILR